MIVKNRKVVYLSVIIIAFLVLRIPLLDKPLQHDEIVNTYVYLHTLPLLHVHPENSANFERESGWALAWKRQIAIHPPFSYLFYYSWIRIFGDSAISLHIPALLSGLGGIMIFFYAGLLIFGPEVSFLAILATTLSMSHIGYSTMGLHPVFELFIFGATLFCFIKFIEIRSRLLLNILMALNLFGVLLFYHYLVYLAVQTIVLWLYKNEVRVPRYYFACVTAAAIGFACIVIAGISWHSYDYGNDFWMKNNVSAIISAMAWLPFSFSAEGNVTTTAGIAARSFSMFLFIAFCWGSVSVAVSSVRSKDRNTLPRLVLIALFFLPFLAYLALGLLGIPFGDDRNFFYLLPIYFFFVFYGLMKLASRKKLFYAALFFVFTVLASSAIVSCPVLWNHRFPEKEISELAAKSDTDFTILVGGDDFIFSYYLKRYGISDKTYMSYDPAVDEASFLSDLNDCAGKLRDAKKFAIIRRVAVGGTPLKNKYTVGGKTFRLANTASYEYRIRQLRLLQKFIKKPLVITVSIYCAK